MLTPVLYIKLGIVAALIAGAALLSWRVRSATAKEDQDKAVATAVNDISTKLDSERAARMRAESYSDEKLEKLLKSLSQVQAQQAQLKDSIAKERLANKAFYQQALPPGGYESWKNARALTAPLTAPPALPAASAPLP